MKNSEPPYKLLAVTNLYRFGQFVLDPARRTLSRADSPVPLTPKAFDVLLFLVQNPNRLVTKEELLQAVWASTFVEDGNLTQYISHLRKALGDNSEDTRLIVTVARKGYQFTPDVTVAEVADTARQTPATAIASEIRKDSKQIRRRILRYSFAAGILLLLAGLGMWAFWRTHDSVTLLPSDAIVLTDIDNQTSDPALGPGMSTALEVALMQTPYLNLLGTDKIHETLHALNLPDDTKVSVSSELAKQVCEHTHSRGILSGSIKDLGNRYGIELQVINCETGARFARVTNEAETRDDIVRLLGVTATQLRAKLGESKDSIARFNQPLELATSSSPDALQFLASGYRNQLHGDLPAAVADYNRAIEKDPNFALAYAAEGSANGWLYKDGLVGLSKAFELRNRLTIPSRFQVETLFYGDGRKEWDKDCRVAQEWVQAFRRDVIARTNFSTCLSYLGQRDEELVQSREAARLLPSEPTLAHLLIAAIYAQRFDEAKETYDQAISRGMNSPILHLFHAELAFLQNDKSGMQKEWAWASQDPVRGRFVLYQESMAEAFYGHARNAHRLAQLDVDSSTKAGLLSDAAFFESGDALMNAEIGNLRQSQALVTDAVRKSQDPKALTFASFTFARAGDAQRSQKLVEKLSQLFPNDFTIQVFSLPATRAAIKLDENDPAAAIEILRPVTPYDLAMTYNFDYVYPTYLRGLAYLQLREGDLAAAEFRKVLDHSGIVHGFVTGALSILQLARAQVVMHDEEAARKSYEDFLALWKNADPDVPIYKEAKAEYAALIKTHSN